MKIPLVIAACFVLSGSAAVAGINGQNAARGVNLEAAGCGAAGSCNGFGGADLCNDRCKRCSGPTGYYARGDCCGTLGQACCCYYE